MNFTNAMMGHLITVSKPFPSRDKDKAQLDFFCNAGFIRVIVHCSPSLFFLHLPSPQVKCPGQTTLQGMATQETQCMDLRVGITHHLPRMASLPMVALNQTTLLPLTPLIQVPRSTQASQGVILLPHIQDSLSPLGNQEQATLVPLPCPLSSHPPYHQIC